MNENKKLSKSVANGGKGKSGKKPFSKNKSNKRDRINVEDINPKKAKNDFKWYDLNPQLTKDVSSLPAAWATGLPLNKTRRLFGLNGDDYIPGILTMTVATDPLSLGNYDDPVNVASRSMVAFIRSFNSGARNYDPTDYMIRLIAEADVIAFINYATRVYATYNLYSPVNRYLPDALLEAQYIDPNSIKNEAAAFRAALNNRIALASNILYIPEQLDLYQRYSMLFKNYYCDSESAKDQIYMMAPYGYHVFEIDPNTSMGMLKYYRWGSTTVGPNDVRPVPVKHTWQDIIAAIDQMLAPLIEDQDLCIINGDMIKAYGGNTITFGMIPDIITAIPVAEPTVLWQFKNSRTLPETAWDDFLDIYQDTTASYLKRGADLKDATAQQAFSVVNTGTGVETVVGVPASVFNVSAMDYASDLVCDSDQLDFNYELTMENTRLAPMIKSTHTDSQGDKFYTYTSGAEVPMFYTLTSKDFSGAINHHVFTNLIYANITLPGFLFKMTTSHTFHDLYSCAKLEDELSAFDYAPTIWPNYAVVTGDENNGYSEQLYLSGSQRMSMCNVKLIPTEMMSKMNDVAMLSLLGIKGPATM